MKNELILLSIILILSGCQSSRQTQIPRVSTDLFPQEPIPIETKTSTPTITPSWTPTLTPTPIVSPCSPLAGIELSELHSITSNTFSHSSPFADTGHPAVDLAFFTYKDFKTMNGHPVQSIIPGTVSLVVNNRFPYGNMILIETRMDQISGEFFQGIILPTPVPSEYIDILSSCPENLAENPASTSSKSIYILYAHLLEAPDFKPGDTVICGQEIGKVGISGNSVAEHLHLEVRIGPAAAEFGTFASYLTDASEEERNNYCNWAFSGQFQAIDPALLWQARP